jgi:hypothetical protein
MKHQTLCRLSILLFFAFSLAWSQGTQTEGQKLTLRVSSSTDQQVSFVGSIFFMTQKPRVDHVVQQTPYEIASESNYVNATIIKTSGAGNLVVELIKKKPSGQPNLKAAGSTVVVGTQDAEKGKYYQHTF